MAVNDRFMLPKTVLHMENMADLLEAEQTELDDLSLCIKEQQNQLFIDTATWFLDRYDKMFALPSTDESYELRRRKIIAKLNTRCPLTVEALEKIAGVLTGNICKVKECYNEYRFTIDVDNKAESEIDVLSFIECIREIKPAHLLFGLNVLKSNELCIYTACNVETKRDYSYGAAIAPTISKMVIFAANTLQTHEAITLATKLTASQESWFSRKEVINNLS